ncbi:hypothetical protein BDW60DRAFT_103355 [Aspergillus nidulans var. acristatus]
MSDSHRDLLHYIPLLTTTGTIMFTLCEDLYLRPFTQLPHSARPTLNEILPRYIGRWFPSGFGVILVLYPLTWMTVVANLSRKRGLQQPKAAWRWNAAGLFFSVMHMWWGRRAKALLDDIRAGRSQPDYEDSVAVLAAWLRLNIRRGLLADLPAWMSFLVGAICR